MGNRKHVTYYTSGGGKVKLFLYNGRMLPSLLQVGPFVLYSFGVFLFLGLFFGLFWFWRLGREEHLEEKDLFDVGFQLMFVFFLAARAGYILLTWPKMADFRVWLALLSHPGFSYWIGLLAVLGGVLYIVAKRKWEKWVVLDIVTLALNLTLIFGGIGALLNGSNPGKVMSIMAFRYPGYIESRFSVDLLTLAWYAVVFAVLSKVHRNFRFYEWYKFGRGEAKPGLAFYGFVFFSGIYLVVRGFLDDNLRMLFGDIPLMSVAGILLALVAGIAVYTRSGRTLARTLPQKRLGLVQLPRRKRRII